MTSDQQPGRLRITGPKSGDQPFTLTFRQYGIMLDGILVLDDQHIQRIFPVEQYVFW